jgi:Kef-type K+ transport system membrane component KefB
VFGLDVVLGAFAAGMILRRLVEEFGIRRVETSEETARDLPEELQRRLDTVGYSLFIPVFFVVSGMGISVEAVAAAPMLLVAAVASMLIIRGGGVWLGETLFHVNPGLPTTRDRARVGLYSATGLPIIVAVTEVAVNIDLMKAEDAAVLVAAGALTVLMFPLLAEVAGTPLPIGRRRASDTAQDTGGRDPSAPGRAPGHDQNDDDSHDDIHDEERIR